jgi:hypothetical protein
MADYELDYGDSDGDDQQTRRRGDDEDVEGEEDESVGLVENGIVIEPFNMKKERGEGFIDSSGHFIENRNWQDAWLDEVEEAEKKKSKSKVRVLFFMRASCAQIPPNFSSHSAIDPCILLCPPRYAEIYRVFFFLILVIGSCGRR